ncbi:autotransporter outer membrane beta-barrel domain-containing protein [Pseudomonas sp. LS44]|uniref:autotransporter family protein n=1 Tax=Pseudomonas sp. LS44 TaxID=1357074 RepID=UPI00215B52F4|nr:autotransporter outer membrane beta-barrel domain-containing protein [Pseudomonas sp. LS44]UVE19454.1 autotransporter outer membrane beta-barrel domain-containing protein [Pseudomonas sp. LS44]
MLMISLKSTSARLLAHPLPLALAISVAIPQLSQAQTVIPSSTTTVQLQGVSPTDAEVLLPAGNSVNTAAGNGIEGDTSQDWKLSNQGTISGASHGVFLQSASGNASFDNAGNVSGGSGSDDAAVFFSGGGSLTQAAGGTLNGTHGAVFDGGSVAGSNAGNITAGGNGLWLRNGASGSFVNSGRVETSTRAVYVTDGGSLELTGVGSLVASGTGVAGVFSDKGSNVVMRGGNITVSGDNSKGLLSSWRGASLSASDVQINVTGNNMAIGAFAAGTGDGVDSLTLSGGSINVQGSGAFGLAASNYDVLTANNVAISVSGLNSGGATSQDYSQMTLNGGSITTTGEGAEGLLVYGVPAPASVGRLPTSPSPGLVPVPLNAVQGQPGASIVSNRITISTSGANAHGAILRDSGAVTLTDSRLSTSGAGAAAIVSEKGDQSNGVNTVAIERSTITSGLAAGISVTDSTLNMTLDNSSLSGGTALYQVASTGTLNLLARSSTLTGAALTDAGGIANVTLVDSTWNFSNAPVDGVFNTLRVNSYTGAGTLALNTVLAGDGSPSDKLLIDGGTATGSSQLQIKNAGGAGELTTGNGILVVDTINGGTTAADAFALSGRVVAGPYEYTLQRSSIEGSLQRSSTDGSNEQAWYLRSSETPTPPSPPSPPSPPAPPSPPSPPAPPAPPAPPRPNYRPETSLYTAVPALALVYSRAIIDTLHERVGEERRLAGAPLPADNQEAYGPSLGWGRAIYRHGEQERSHSGPFGETPEYDYDLSAFQVGLDLYRSEATDGSTNQAGLSLAIGTIDGSIEHYNGADAGDDTLRAYSLGGYWTHFGPAGWYLDGVLQLNRFDIEAKPDSMGKLDTDGWGYTASLEGGYPFQIDKDLYIEPQAQVIYSSVDLDDSHDIAADVRFKDVESLIGRAGVRLDKDWYREAMNGEVLRTSLWVRPSVWHEFKGDPKTEFSSARGFVPFDADLGGSWGEVNVGLDWQAGADTSFYVSAGYQKAVDGDNHSYEGMLGVKVAF